MRSESGNTSVSPQIMAFGYGGPSTPPGGYGSGSYGSPGTGPVPGGGLSANAAAALAYAFSWISGLVFLFLAPYNRDRFVRFAAFQSIFIAVVLFVINVILRILILIVPALLAPIGILFLLIYLAFFVLWVFLLVRSLQGKKVVLPVIGPLAERQAGV